MSKALDIAENLALLSTKYTSSSSTLDSVVLGASTTDHSSRALTGTFNGTLGSSTTFPAGHVIKTYYAEYTESNSTTYSVDTWHDIPNLSITTDTPQSTSSKFLLFGHTVHGSNADWSAKFRFYNATTSLPVSVATTRSQGLEVFSTFIGGHTFPDSTADMFNGYGTGYQPSNNGSAQNFKLQGYSGRSGYILNRQWATNNDDISGNATICSLTVMEIA